MATSQEQPVKRRRRQPWPEASKHTALLIIGAGPFGLAMAAQAQELGVDHVPGSQQPF